MRLKLTLYFLAAIAVAGFGAGAAFAQEQLPAPSPIEKEIAARASDVTEVTLDKSMLAFASQFMTDKDEDSNGDKARKHKDEAEAKEMLNKLDGIYVRTYEFDKDGAYTLDELEQLRKYFTNGGEWQTLVKERSQRDGESTDVMVKLVGGQNHGMFVLTAEPKELTIVLILGPIQMDQLQKLNVLGAGLGSLPNQTVMVGDTAQAKANAEQLKNTEKQKKAAAKERKEAEKNRQAIEKGNQQEEK